MKSIVSILSVVLVFAVATVASAQPPWAGKGGGKFGWGQGKFGVGPGQFGDPRQMAEHRKERGEPKQMGKRPNFGHVPPGAREFGPPMSGNRPWGPGMQRGPRGPQGGFPGWERGKVSDHRDGHHGRKGQHHGNKHRDQKSTKEQKPRGDH